MNWTAAGALVALLGLTGCSTPGYFVCTMDAECTEAEGGRCEASGACSVPDTNCPTGRRYGELGNPDLAGKCVPAAELGSTGADPTVAGGSADSGTTSSGSETGLASTSTGAASTSSGLADDSGTTSSGGSSGSSSSTGAVVPRDMWDACGDGGLCSQVCISVLPPLAQDPVGDWCTGFVCEDPLEDCIDPGSGATPDCLLFEFEGEVAPRCFLDCTATGTAGCPDGMQCFDNIPMSPSRCAHPAGG